MGKKLYVESLSYSVDKAHLEQLFTAYGAVTSVQVIMDRDSGRSKGFGFVEMSNDQEAQAAISALNGKDIEGRAMVVNEARPQAPRTGGFGGGAGGAGFGGGGGRDRGFGGGKGGRGGY